MGRREQADAALRILGAVMAGALARDGLGVGLDENARAGVFLLGEDQHLAEDMGTHARQPHRGIAAQLVDHQHIAGRRGWQIGVMGVVFRQIERGQTRHPVMRAAQQVAVIERGFGQDPLQPRGAGGVEMHAQMIGDEAQRRAPAPPSGMERAQEGILEADQPGGAARGNRFGTPGGGAGAPEPDQIALPGQAQPQRPAGLRQHLPQRPAHQPAVVDEKRPLGQIPGGRPFGCHQSPVRLLNALTVETGPVRADSDFCQVT